MEGVIVLTFVSGICILTLHIRSYSIGACVNITHVEPCLDSNVAVSLIKKIRTSQCTRLEN